MDSHAFDQTPVQGDELSPDLQAVARSYRAQPVPHPSSAETAQLLHTLLTEAAFQTQEMHDESNDHLWHILVLARWRVYLLGQWFWIIGIVFLLAGILLARFLTVPDLITLLILLLPLASVLSLAYALRKPSDGLRAVEASCPANFVQTGMGMGLALLAFDSLLGLAATLGFALANWAPFWHLLLAWLAPLLLLTAISLPLALLRSVRLAVLIGGGPWLLLGLLALNEQHGSGVTNVLFSLPQDPFSFSYHLVTILLSLLLLTVLFLSAPKWQRFCAF
ncbi:hypothetical protein [Ktedonospora formicarum]|uniref:Uncharacterized protein n=1 Tax=Ktedonospora formicarum TaxID=2778364 RepID=A0A8J3MVA7_9CHLR|nr:hypothetical protein [Ktedonospora formicarum]GHO47473.1 hypothetical protein KSX_56360 [Ktedonospora formicarum]